jgi:hypothetical protein
VSVTHCLGPFAQSLRRLPLTNAAWKQAIDAQPETCPNGCNANCREVCRDYAEMQRKMIRNRQETKS